MDWMLFTLTFVLGYMTCKALYFLRATRTSVQLIKISQLISLGMLARSMEHFTYSKIYRAEKMRASNESSHNIRSFILRHEDEVARYQHKTVKEIVNSHPDFFKRLVDFDDWKSGMAHLNENKEIMMAFFSKDEEHK